MKKLFICLILPVIFFSCKNSSKAPQTSQPDNHSKLAAIMNNYWQERMQLFPFDATSNGDNRYNDRFTITIANSFRDSLKRFYQKYLDQVNQVDTTGLDDNDMISYRLMKYEMHMGLDGLKFPTNYMPINQFWARTLDMPQMGAGTGNQPFKTVKDYDNWLKRLSVFPAWTDTAIYNMRKGIATGWVLPKTLVVKVLPELKSVVVKNETSSIFYGPIKRMPATFSVADRKRLKTAYIKAIDSIVNPCYTKLYDFMKTVYLPKARLTSGVNALPDGDAYYRYCIRYWTTTNLTPDSIYNLGLQQVAWFEKEMNKVKDEVGYKGSMQSFFKYLKTNPRFFPFKTPKQVLDSFWGIKRMEEPKLKNYL